MLPTYSLFYYEFMWRIGARLEFASPSGPFIHCSTSVSTWCPGPTMDPFVAVEISQVLLSCIELDIEIGLPPYISQLEEIRKRALSESKANTLRRFWDDWHATVFQDISAPTRTT